MSCPACGHDDEAVVAASWTLSLPIAAKSANSRTVNAGASRWKYADERRAWVMAIAWRMREVKMPKATGFRRVTITRLIGKGSRMFDHANMIGGLKSCVDALVRCGALVDDNAKMVAISYKQERRATAGVEIVIEELAP